MAKSDVVDTDQCCDEKSGRSPQKSEAVAHQQIVHGVTGLDWHRVDASGIELNSLRQVLEIPELSVID
ncbi:hypothetical protein [Sneathiella litorea]|uniref:Uncharacterized protein n=1 Tax=Sneathiella litorea TaxID=2606216 RepID=A0A6L8W4R7_9PROT|nr:hypothetical protein [Sneathiella litorea]MZR30091.1 hypothetical protein [Sneathiella litorea]